MVVYVMNKHKFVKNAKMKYKKCKNPICDNLSRRFEDQFCSLICADYFDDIIDRLENRLPGKGNLTERYNNFKKDFVIPIEKLDAVFTTALDECRRRTLQYVNLPESENFEIEYVTDKVWSAYNWYKGNSFSLIQMNTDLPIYIDRAVDLAAHEAYPGHHVFNALLENELYKKRGWIEYTVYPILVRNL